MSAFLWIGAAMALLGIAGLVWCMSRAASLKRSDVSDDEAVRQLRVLVAANVAAVGTAFMGLALVVVGAILS